MGTLRPHRPSGLAAIVASVACASMPVMADEWDDAARATVRLPPHAFAILPPGVAAHFEALGCTVPQPSPDPYGPLEMQNAMRGSFARRGQVDYAIVCSIDGKSRIEVLWGGQARCPAIEEPGEDKGYLQGIGDGAIGYSRVVRTASQRTIADYRRAFHGEAPPDRTHQGIEDYFQDKASVILYCSHGRWGTLQGMD